MPNALPALTAAQFERHYDAITSAMAGVPQVSPWSDVTPRQPSERRLGYRLSSGAYVEFSGEPGSVALDADECPRPTLTVQIPSGEIVEASLSADFVEPSAERTAELVADYDAAIARGWKD